MQPRILAICTIASLLYSTANAESLALVVGRQAVFKSEPRVSAEIGAIKFDEGNYFGGRVNYKYSDTMVLYGDVGQTDTDSNNIRTDGGSVNLDGNLFGLGFYRSVKKLENGYDVAIRGSYHQGELSLNDSLFNAQSQPVGIAIDASEISLEFIVSNPTPLTESGLRWYAGAGVHRLESTATVSAGGASQKNSDKDTEAGASLGVTLPFVTGVLYAGAEYVQEASYGIGFRHYFSP